MSPELLNLRTFPTLMGYSSRILAESWESNLLYYAALADEIHAYARAVECPDSGVDAADRGANFRDSSGRLAGPVASLRLVGDDARKNAQTGRRNAAGGANRTFSQSRAHRNGLA